jgi:hypothetical protein
VFASHFSLFFLLAAPLAAQVVVSEIMFNPMAKSATRNLSNLYSRADTLDLAGWPLASDGPSSPIHGFGETSLLHPGNMAIIFPSRYFENNSLYNSLILPLPPLLCRCSTLGENGLANTRGETVELRSCLLIRQQMATVSFSVPAATSVCSPPPVITNPPFCRHIGVPWYPCEWVAA